MPPRAKVQSPAALVGLSVVTLGVYLLVWYHRVNREMRDLGRAYGDVVLAMSRPANSVWALVTGGFVVVPAIVSIIGATDRLRRCERIFSRRNGAGTTVVALVSAALATGFGSAFSTASPTAPVLAVASAALWLTAAAAFQRRLNALWRKEPPLVPRPSRVVAARGLR
jgi:hypothetical protein